MRSTYSTRAALIVSANAVITTAIVILLDRTLPQTTGRLKIAVIITSGGSLILMLTSLYQAFSAAVTRGSSKKATNYDGPSRIFLNPRETFDTIGEGVAAFKDRFKNLSLQEFIDAACGEFWVDMHLQNIRYGRLKKSLGYLSAAFVCFVITLVLTVFR